MYLTQRHLSIISHWKLVQTNLVRERLDPQDYQISTHGTNKKRNLSMQILHFWDKIPITKVRRSARWRVSHCSRRDIEIHFKGETIDLVIISLTWFEFLKIKNPQVSNGSIPIFKTITKPVNLKIYIGMKEYVLRDVKIGE